MTVIARTYCLRKGESILPEELRRLADQGFSLVQWWELGPNSAYGPKGLNLVFERDQDE